MIRRRDKVKYELLSLASLEIIRVVCLGTEKEGSQLKWLIQLQWQPVSKHMTPHSEFIS